MTDDQMVGQRLRADLERIQAPEPQLDQLFDRARRRRTRRLAAAWAVVGLVFVGLGVSLVLQSPLRGAGPASPATTPTPSATRPPSAQRLALPPAQSGWAWRVDQVAGVAIQAPKGWTFKTAVVGVAEPTALIALGTGSIPSGGDCAPTAAIRALPKDGVLLWVLEYRNPETPYEFPPRRARFDLGPLLGPFECVGERTHLVSFRQAGRFFQVHVMFGPEAAATLRADAVAALSSLTPEPRGASTQQQCQQGGWIYCPEAAWVFQIINQADYFHWGNTGKAIEAGPKGGPETAKVNIWATKAEPGGLQTRYRLVAVAEGVTIYGDSTTLVWRAQGLDVRVQPGAGSRAALPSGKALDRLVKASLQTPFLDDRG
jgi:hypothetical protein